MFGSWPKFKVGKVGSVPIRLDASFALVPVFLLSGLPMSTLGDAWLVVVAGTVGIFLSIFLHECGHALVARKHRVGVSEIVVGGFYGYARLKFHAVPRGAMIQILAAGPLVNLVICLVAGVLLQTLQSSELSVRGIALSGENLDDWPTYFAYMLAVVNLAMFAFNLLPVFPLDGGRILGHVLDKGLSLQTNLRVVSGLSIIGGSLMILLGFGANIVLAIIGFFVVMLNEKWFGLSEQAG